MHPTPDSSLLIDLSGLQAALREFAAARDWQRHHAPKNLAMALAGEVGELVALFQWVSEADSHGLAREPAHAEDVRDELADVQIYLARLADMLGVDMNAAVAAKLAKNARKYPVPGALASDTGS